MLHKLQYITLFFFFFTRKMQLTIFSKCNSTSGSCQMMQKNSFAEFMFHPLTTSNISNCAF
ncbi:hypothetical protein AAHE18_05G188300 [Arachis hypogaea]